MKKSELRLFAPQDSLFGIHVREKIISERRKMTRSKASLVNIIAEEELIKLSKSPNCQKMLKLSKKTFMKKLNFRGVQDEAQKSCIGDNDRGRGGADG